MTTQKDPENIDDVAPESVTDDSTDNTTETTTTNTQQSPTSGEDWESRYKGQQRVMAKKDAQIQELQDKLDKMNTRLEELIPTVDQTKKEKGELEGAKAELEKQLEEARQDALLAKSKLAQTEIIMQEFTDLSPVAEWIPPSDDPDTFRANATKFREAIGSMLENKVKDVMVGSSPPQPAGKDGLASSAEEDELWQKLMTTAGIPGKEEEYERLRAQWVNIQNTKQ